MELAASLIELELSVIFVGALFVAAVSTAVVEVNAMLPEPALTTSAAAAVLT